MPWIEVAFWTSMVSLAPLPFLVNCTYCVADTKLHRNTLSRDLRKSPFLFSPAWLALSLDFFLLGKEGRELYKDCQFRVMRSFRATMSQDPSASLGIFLPIIL